MAACENLDSLMLWSDEIKDLELMTCTNLRVVELYCPQLLQENLFLPKLREVPPVCQLPAPPPAIYGLCFPCCAPHLNAVVALRRRF